MTLYVVTSTRPLAFSVDAQSEEEAISLAVSAISGLSDDQQYDIDNHLFEVEEDEPYVDEGEEGEQTA